MDNQDERSRRERLFNIIHIYFGNENDYVVEAISEATGQKVTVRSVQAWLIAPDKASHRRIPDWALKGLEDYIQRPGKAEQLKMRTALREQRRFEAKSGTERILDVRNKQAVELATREIELDGYKRQQLRDEFGKTGGDKLFERFNSLEKEAAMDRQVLRSLLRAIDECSDWDALKVRIAESIQSDSLVRSFVGEAKVDIEQGTNEFSNAEGLPVRGPKG